ncbi:TetR family transcriptional regulator C-terminal domain-containing protein [Streptomyces sp. NPDC004270]
MLDEGCLHPSGGQGFGHVRPPTRKQALGRIEGSLAECVQAAQRHGDLDPEADAHEISQLLMAINRGMEVMARAGLDTAGLGRVADQAFAGLPLTARARSHQTPRPVASGAS